MLKNFAQFKNSSYLCNVKQNKQQDMEKKELISDYQKLSILELRTKIRQLFKEGTIAFEHGFKLPTFTNNHVTYSVSMIDSDMTMHCKSVMGNNVFTRRATCLRKPQLLKLIRTINEYYNYCLTQA